MRVVVTGATGKVGSRLVPRLTQAFDDVSVFVRDKRKAENLAAVGATVVGGDIRSADDRRLAVSGADAVVHLAAAFRGVSADESAAVNDTATRALAEAAVDAGVRRFIYISTNLVYGAGRGRPAREDDDLRVAPEAAYPASKARAESGLIDLSRSAPLGLRILRLAFVYGEGDSHLADAVPFAAARGWGAHKRLHLVHHADVGQAIVRALRTEGIDGQAFNIADDAPLTCWEIYAINRVVPPKELADLPDRDPWEGIVDTGRARAELGFRPLFPSVYVARDAGAL